MRRCQEARCALDTMCRVAPSTSNPKSSSSVSLLICFFSCLHIQSAPAKFKALLRLLGTSEDAALRRSLPELLMISCAWWCRSRQPQLNKQPWSQATTTTSPPLWRHSSTSLLHFEPSVLEAFKRRPEPKTEYQNLRSKGT